MARRFARELRDLSDDEIRAKLRELRAEQLHIGYAFSIKTPPSQGGRNPNTALMQNIKRDIARCLTILKEREVEREIADRIRKVLRPDGYGLLTRQIKRKAGLGLHPSLVAQVCSRMPDMERVNADDSKARWRLRR